MLMQKCFFFIAVFFIFRCSALELSKEESSVLERFFRTMVENSEGGYVLFGKKPLCIHGYLKRDCFLGEYDSHLSSVYLRESASVIKKANLNNIKNNIIIHVYNNQDSLAKNYIHILFVNKKLFLKTVQENLSLFQYVLGPEVTPQNLLEKLIDPHERFHSVLKNDKVLIGILLGFGVQNALYVSRLENIEEELFAAEHPPFKKAIYKNENIQKEFKEMLLMRDKSPGRKNLNFSVSFGYHSLDEEIENLSKKIEISSQKLVQKSPQFFFGRVKGNHEDAFISSLEETQNTISNFLQSATFFADVLKIIDPTKEISIPIEYNKNKLLAFNDTEKKQLSFLVAANIWNLIDDEDLEYRKSFIEGMNDANIGIARSNFTDEFDYRKLKAISKAQNSIKNADEFFFRLDHDEDFICLLPLKLYYKVIIPGSGQQLTDQIQATIHYTIKNPNEEAVSDTWASGTPAQVCLSDMIPGLSQGLQEMKIGEVREIYIHPELAYGVYTTFEKGVHLKARVQLLTFENNENGKVIHQPNIVHLQKPDQNFYIKIDENEIHELGKKAGYASGHKIWQHYKKSNLYNLSAVLDWMGQFQAGVSADIISETNQDLINRLHWNIYIEKFCSK